MDSLDNSKEAISRRKPFARASMRHFEGEGSHPGSRGDHTWKYHSLLEIIPQAVMVVSDGGMLAEANEAALSMLGISGRAAVASVFDAPVEWYGKDLSRITREAHPFTTVLTRGTPVRDLTLGVSPHGITECRWFEFSAVPAPPGPDGISSWALAVLTETTDTMKPAHRATDERFRGIVDTLVEYIYTVRFENDRPAQIISNEGCTMVTGYTPGELYGCDERLMDIVHPEDRERVLANFALEKKPCLKPIEYRIIRKDGSERWVCNVPTLNFNLDGSIRSIEGVIQDITERKVAELRFLESERRFREMFETSADGIASTDFEGRILDYNPAYAEMLGGVSPSELTSLSYREPTDPSYHGLDSAMIRHTREHGLCPVYEKEYVKKIGERFQANVRRWLRCDGSGRAIGQWVIVRDITDKKKLDAEIFKVQHLESLATLAGGIAHDFNNLLGGIFGYIDLACTQSGPSDKTREFLEKALRSLDRAKDLSQRLLTFSKGGEPEKSLASVGSIIRETTVLSLSGRNVRPRFDIEANLAPCEIDIGQISRVVNNILLNAVQAMPGGGTLYITAHNVTITRNEIPPLAEGPYVRVSVLDEGPGIPEAIIGKVFDPFYTTKADGTGLGLSICLSVIRRHQGHIAVQPGRNGGAEVVFFLPSSRNSLVVEEKTAAVCPLRGKGRILVMDDEEFVIDITSHMLSDLGYRVKTAQHGEDALALYREALERNDRFDAVILDLTIPGGMGGVQTCQRILSADSRAMVIASSGYSNDPVMASPREYGFASTLKKPYLMVDLSSVVGRVTGGTPALRPDSA